MIASSLVAAPRVDVPVTSTLTVWAVLLSVALVALLGLAALGRRHQPTAGRLSVSDYLRLTAEAQELARDATAAAERAQAETTRLARARTRQAQAQQAREAAGHASDEAQRAYHEALTAWRAHEAQRAARVRTPEDDELERTVSRAALGAFRRGDVSVEQLREVFRRTGGWDPVQEQLEYEVGRLRAEALHQHRAYEAAVVAERSADQTVSVTEVAARALVEEAAEAAEDARVAATAAQECLQALRRRRFRPGAGRLRTAGPQWIAGTALAPAELPAGTRPGTAQQSPAEGDPAGRQ